MEPRACLAHWEGDKLTLYTPTGGIANCQHDTARDLGLPDDKVRIVCQYMGGNFGNKNQNQDADLIAAMLAKQAGAPVMLELSRREDWLGMHGRWHTVQYYKVGAKNDGTVTAIQLRGYSGMGGYRKNSGAISGLELYSCPNAASTVYPVYTNRTTSGNFRGPSDPQGFFGIESMMDDVAYKLGIDPVEFAMKNMRQAGAGAVTFTNYSLDECIRRGAELFDWKSRWRPVPGSDRGPVKRGAGMSFMMFRAGTGPEQRGPARRREGALHAVRRRHRRRRRRQDDDGDDRRRGARRAVVAGGRRLGRHGSVPVFGRRVRQPHDHHDRLRGRRGGARSQEADRRKGHAGRRATSWSHRSHPNPSTDGKVRNCFGAHFVEVEVDTQLGTVRVTKYVAVHESGRIMNPQTAKDQIRGAAQQGIGQALHEDLLYDKRNGQPLTAGYYGARHLTHLDARRHRGHLHRGGRRLRAVRREDGRRVGHHPAAGGGRRTRSSTRIGRRMKDLPITRDKILGALA